MNLGNDIIKKHVIYTSYFGNIRHISASCCQPFFVSIAGNSPNWFDGDKYKQLMPKYDWWIKWHNLFKDKLDSDQSINWYIKRYNETILSMLDPYDVKNDLLKMSNGKDIFLLCYETPAKFCHRHIVCEWLNKNNILCKEWKDEDTN